MGCVVTMTAPPAVNNQTSPTSTAPASSAAGMPPPLRSDWVSEYPPPRSLPLDQEALRIFEHAYAIGLKVEPLDDPAITFSTLMLALLEGRDETSQWFARLASTLGPIPDLVFSEKNTDRTTVQSLVPNPGKPEPVRLAADKHLLTSSARGVLETAEGWAQRVGGSDIGVRHLVASYVLNPPPQHRRQLANWQYQNAKWRKAFFEWVATRYTAEQWLDASQRPAPAAPAHAFEQQEVKGESLAFPGDPHTLTVLTTAAAYHANRKDQWLRLRTVFHALVDTARHDTSMATTIRPLLDAVDAAGSEYQRALAEYRAEQGPAKPPVPFTALDISPRVLNTLETARELEVATQTVNDAEPLVGLLHLAGALVARRGGADETRVPMGLKLPELRIALIDYAAAAGESTEVWREALGEEEDVQCGRPLELNSDEPEAVVRLDEEWTSDPLGIRRDVRTFAALLASERLEPPLSIGLFGPWGSGKTTFLKRLRREVEGLAQEAQQAVAAGHSTPYVRNVVHVDFNAWHFAESALTSSLVDTILRELRQHIQDDKVMDGKAWWQQKLDELETAQRRTEAAEAVQRAVQSKVNEAETALTVKRAAAAQAVTSFQAVLQRIWTATTAALQGSDVVKDSGVIEAVGDTVKSAEELRERLATLRARPARLLGDLGWKKALGFAALVLIVPPFVAWLTSRILRGTEATQVLSFITASLAVIGTWARAATGAVSKVDKAIAQVAQAYETRIANDPDVREAQKGLDAAQASAATAAAGLDAARAALACAQVEAANATLPAQILRLASSRIDDQTYNKELTTLSLARADLEKLSRILRDQRSVAPVAPPSVAEALAVDRVILYIDDLDRCKPQDVVRVLQLVHMLLAFELFVVVVAVDARWVSESLKQSYHWLADGDGVQHDGAGDGAGHPQSQMGHLSPQDYLEKIFQIAFWLEPMTVSQAAGYLASLVGDSGDSGRPPVGSATAPETASGAPPAEVHIASIELDYMRYLAAYVGTSPRRVKRFVNAYRLIKAGMSDSQLGTFITQRAADDGGQRSGPYQLVIGLLVIGTGAPSSSAQILTELAECHPGLPMETVVERLRSREHPDWTMAAQVIEALARSQKAKNVAELRGWAQKVRRFLLNGGQDSPAGGVKVLQAV